MSGRPLDRAVGSAPPLRWLEIAADHRCNQRCLGCPASDVGPSLGARELVASLERGRSLGITQLWIGGGEPTLRRDLVALVREARARGYERVKLQTNAAMLAYPELVERLAAAGVTEVAVSIKGPDAATHDHFARVPGAFDLLVRGIANVRARALALEGDVLLYRSTTARLPETIGTFFALGVPRFRVWQLAPDPAEPATLGEEPRLAEVADAVARTLELGLSPHADHVVSLHSPPCTLWGAAARARFFAPDLGLLVHDAGGSVFRLEESPMEGGHFTPRCDGCTLRARCGGVRRAYVERHGDGELRPRSSREHDAP